MKILVIHGPNLQLLGRRQPTIYGKADLTTINRDLTRFAATRKATLTITQSNHEGQIVELIGSAKGRFDGLLINPAAYTHTSVAIRDAIEAAGIPAVEVHLSAVDEREDWRRVSVVRDLCAGTVQGKGADGYREALEILKRELDR